MYAINFRYIKCIKFSKQKNFNHDSLSVHLFQFKNHYVYNTQPLELNKHIRMPVNVNI